MVPTALVPVRLTPVPKRRLAHAATAGQRAELVQALFEHVVAVLREAGLDVVALAPHPLTLPGIQVWRDAANGLNAAVDLAIERTGLPVIIVHADLPELGSSDVVALLDSPADVVIARATDGGTNALLMRRRIRPIFGAGSALAHARRARAAGLRTQVIDRPGLAVDVDDESAFSVWRAGAARRPQP
jgi:2-phospho-L-lactate/phosphoenolpyruvate guanylyltransferase